MTNGTIRWAVDGAVGVATIDRPERRNALNAELCNELRTYLEGAAALRAVVITGAGDKAFCAGADIGVRSDDLGGRMEHGGEDTFRPAFDLLLEAIVGHRAPVIAAINGHALGAGMQLAVACDLRVVARHAALGIPAAKLGVLLTAANVARLADLVGQAHARDLLLTGRTIDADEAALMGIAQRVVDDALESARELARDLAALAPLSVQGHKRALNLIARGIDEAARAELAALEAGAFASRDLREGLAAFNEKRPPRFEGV